MLRKIFFILTILLIIFVGIRVNNPKNKQTATDAINQVTSKVTKAEFNKSKYSTTDPTSIWVVVNKQHPLNPKTYAPFDLVIPNVKVKIAGDETMKLRKQAATAVESMFAAAKTENVNLMLISDYRSYSNQLALYNSYLKTQGQAITDRSSARAGYSEHQTGWAADVGGTNRVCEIDECFATTAEGKWVAANAYKYGFIVRYPPDKETTTGYQFEPWHLRYVGVELSTEMQTTGITTLEEFFGITGGQSY